MATDVAAEIIPGVQNYTKHDALFYLSFHHQNKKTQRHVVKRGTGKIIKREKVFPEQTMDLSNYLN